MSCGSLLVERSKKIARIKEIDNENEERKSLIRLAIFKVALLNQIPVGGEEAISRAASPVEANKTITEKNPEYEVLISKLKQQFSTKEKLHESKIDSLNAEITKLKEELKKGKEPNKYSLGNRLPKLLGKLKTSLRNTIHDDANSILSPIRVKQPVETLIGKPVKGELFSLNEGIKDILPPEKDVESSAKSTYMKTFDSSSESPLGTPGLEPDFTKNKNKNKRNEEDPKPKDNADISGDLEAPEANSTSLLHSFANNSDHPSDNETFASAQMNVSSGKSSRKSSDKRPTDPPPSHGKKKRKLQILKANASKIQVSSSLAASQASQMNEELQLEDDINSLNYYHDDNFKNDPTSPQVTKDTTVTADTTTVFNQLQLQKKKKKNVFKID